MTKRDQVSKIVNEVAPGKNIEDRRINALESAGFTVQDWGTQYNWGTSGTVKEKDGEVFAQLHCATGGKSRKTGYHFNVCRIYKVI